MTTPTKLYGIVGHPLGHSLSPLLHNWGFQHLGVPGVYLAWPQRPEQLKDFFTAVRTLPIHGANITLPHKVASMAYVDRLSPRAQAVGAINTLYWDGEALCGENTDVLGFMAPLQGRTFSSALVLGAGGASRAVLAGLKELGVPRIGIANRTPEKARILARDFGVEDVAWEGRVSFEADLLINATSQGMRGEQQDMTPYPQKAFRGTGLAYDIVYTPLETRFLKEARAAGWDTQHGLAMFVEQACAAFRLWTDKELPLKEATELVRRELGV